MLTSCLIRISVVKHTSELLKQQTDAALAPLARRMDIMEAVVKDRINPALTRVSEHDEFIKDLQRRTTTMQNSLDATNAILDQRDVEYEGLSNDVSTLTLQTNNDTYSNKIHVEAIEAKIRQRLEDMQQEFDITKPWHFPYHCYQHGGALPPVAEQAA